MAIRFDKEIWNTLLHRTKEKAANAAEAARTGAAIVGQKAEETLACAKLRASIRELKGEIDSQLKAAGELVYATHQGNPSDSDALQAILERLDALNRDLEDAQRELKILKGALYCDACGTENAATNVYCQECGQPLSRM